MKERITFISLFNNENLEKITKYIDLIKEETCKIPFGKNVSDRITNDTLPYHFTIFSCSIKKEREMLEYLKNIKIPKINALVDKIEIWPGAENSYVLVFHIKKNEELKNFQKNITLAFTNNTYNPENYEFHITIDISKDDKKITRIKEIIEENFEPFTLEVDTFGLYEIYPAKMIQSYKKI